MPLSLSLYTDLNFKHRKCPARAPTQKVQEQNTSPCPHFILATSSNLHQHQGCALALSPNHPFSLSFQLEPSPKTEIIQQGFPYRRCQHWKLLLAFMFPWQPFHGPTNTAVPCLPCHVDVPPQDLSFSHSRQSPAPNHKHPVTAPTRKMTALEAVAGPCLPLPALSHPHPCGALRSPC